MCWKLKSKEEKRKEKLVAKAEKIYRKGLSQEIRKVYEEAPKKFKEILKGQTYSFSSYWNIAYKELANINKLKREKTRRCFRAICLLLLLLGCILIGKAFGVLTGRVDVGLLGGVGAGFLFVALYVLFMSGENDC